MSLHFCLPRLAWPILLCIALLLGTSGIAPAAIVSKVASTKHNLSASSPGTVKATSESQICVFCHTPHNANIKAVAPLWNRELTTLIYTTYTSASMDAVTDQPGYGSKLCLSCHDGALAIGTVGVLNNAGPVAIMMDGTDAGTIPAGAGEFTGYTRNLGMDLSNDHPVSFPYDVTLADNDGELRTPPVDVGGTAIVAKRTAGVAPNPLFPLDSDAQMQCTTCHDPHTWETDPGKGNHKFLRGNRLQQVQSLGGSFSRSDDSMCLACHDKAGALWTYSAHANQLVADETYLEEAAIVRDFPVDTPVWKAACLNCHDTHT
ncbi:MAG: multiheme c-type cytochrome, partial [Gallionella sp.]